jgi:Tfp pilus assembly protein PilV
VAASDLFVVALVVLTIALLALAALQSRHLVGVKDSKKAPVTPGKAASRSVYTATATRSRQAARREAPDRKPTQGRRYASFENREPW